MARSHKVYLVVLGFAFMEIRWTITVEEPDDYRDLCATMVDILMPIPSALLAWSTEGESLLYSDMKSRADLANRSGLLDHWISYAEGKVEGGAGAEEVVDVGNAQNSGFSVTQYLRLLSRVVEKMGRNKDDLTVLYAFSDAFHNVPGALRYEWTDEREERVYENLMMRATDRGIRSEVEQWMYELIGEPAKVRATNLPF